MNNLARDLNVDSVVRSEAFDTLVMFQVVKKKRYGNTGAVEADRAGHSIYVLPNQILVYSLSFHILIIVRVYRFQITESELRIV